MMNPDNLTEYYQFREKLDQTIQHLTHLHQPHLQCAKGCDQCCFSFRVFPVEFYAIAQEQKLKASPDTSLEIGEMERCGFLKNHACTIYPSRPMICRTHGLPLMNMNADGNEWELNICELNFTDADDDAFDDDNVLMQDTINSELFNINKIFIEKHPELHLTEFDLIPLKALLSTER